MTDIAAKVERLLATGALRVMHLAEGHCTVNVEGDTGTWVVSYCPSAGWTCTCPAVRTCSHIRATELCVTTRRRDLVPTSSQVVPTPLELFPDERAAPCLTLT